jgi:hypothetical protein
MNSLKPVYALIAKIALIIVFVFCAGFAFHRCVEAEKEKVVQEFKMTLWTVTVFQYMAQEGILPDKFEFSVEPGPNKKYVLVSIFVNGKLYCKSEVNDKRQGLVQAIDVSELRRTNTTNKELQLAIPLCLNYAIAARGVNLTEGGDVSMTTDGYGGKWLMYDSAVLTVGNFWSVYFHPKENGFSFHGGY